MMKILILMMMILLTHSHWILYTSLFMLMFLLTSLSLTHYTDLFFPTSLFVWDTLSSTLISLSVWISILMFMSSYKIHHYNEFKHLFLYSVVTLLISLTLTFSVFNYFLFYISFEASLIPTFILILGWGYQPERMQAGMYMLLYTLTSSLPLLVSLTLWTYMDSSNNMVCINLIHTTSFISTVWLFSLLSAFLVKLPIYMVHLWLPKAHVEAPVAGSMILAGILLKLGGYGLIRLSMKLTHILTKHNWTLISWVMVGGSIVSIICIRQMDLKSLIALTSVAHMTMVMCGIVTMKMWGMNGATFIMFGHGFCSSALFCVANMTYERTHSRSLVLVKGMQSLAPNMTFWWFILCAANMAVPPSVSLLGELNSTISLLSWSNLLIMPISMLVFWAAVYSLYLYVMTQHGKFTSMTLNFPPYTNLESLTLSLHTTPLFALILTPLLFQPFMC